MTTSENDTQDNPLHGPNLILDVENFGPIAEAKNIEFKPMTVFVGPSNTGKTYLAMLLHSFSQALNNTGFPYIFPIRFAPSVDVTEDEIVGYWESLLSAYDQGESNLPVAAEEFTVNFDWNSQPQEIRRLFFESGSKWGEWAAKHTEDFVVDNFQVKDFSALRRSGTDPKQNPRIQFRDTSDITAVNINAPNSVIRINGAKLIVFGEFLVNAFVNRIASIEEHKEDARREFARSINRSVADQMKRFSKSHYLPASRTGVMAAYGVLAPTTIRTPSNTDSDGESSPRLNRVVRDFLGYLAELNESKPGGTPLASIEQCDPKRVAAILETAVIGGNITVSAREFGIPEIAYELNNLQTPIERTSSLVTELAPIALVLRDHVKPGDLLIIDEPEAHLHPAAQQQMAAALAFMVRSGLRVLITTHSHYMVEQLGNFVAVSTLDEEMRKRVLKLDGALGKEDIYLDESEVAVYDFATDKSEFGSVVETVDFNQDYGYFPRDHNWAIADQMNRTQRVIEARIDQDDPVSAQ